MSDKTETQLGLASNQTKTLHQDGSVFTFLPASPPGATHGDSLETVESLRTPGVETKHGHGLAKLNNE